MDDLQRSPREEKDLAPACVPDKVGKGAGYTEELTLELRKAIGMLGSMAVAQRLQWKLLSIPERWLIWRGRVAERDAWFNPIDWF